jgi:hypothetical protein
MRYVLAMSIRRFVFAALGITAVYASHAAADGSDVANKLGLMLASESYCELRFHQPAIEKFIAANVDETDMGFSSRLALFTAGQQARFKQHTESAKTAHCAQVVRAARKYGFID